MIDTKEKNDRPLARSYREKISVNLWPKTNVFFEMIVKLSLAPNRKHYCNWIHFMNLCKRRMKLEIFLLFLTEGERERRGEEERTKERELKNAIEFRLLLPWITVSYRTICSSVYWSFVDGLFNFHLHTLSLFLSFFLSIASAIWTKWKCLVFSRSNNNYIDR